MIYRPPGFPLSGPGDIMISRSPLHTAILTPSPSRSRRATHRGRIRSSMIGLARSSYLFVLSPFSPRLLLFVVCVRLLGCISAVCRR